MAGGPLASIDEAAMLLVTFHELGQCSPVRVVGKPLKLPIPTALLFYDANSPSPDADGILSVKVPGPQSGQLWPVRGRSDLGVILKTCSVPPKYSGEYQCQMYTLVKRVSHAEEPMASTEPPATQHGECAHHALQMNSTYQ